MSTISTLRFSACVSDRTMLDFLVESRDQVDACNVLPRTAQNQNNTGQISMSEQLRVGVNGAAGRMGQRIVALTHQDEGLQVAAAIEAESSPAVGRDAGEVAGLGNIGVAISPDPGDLDVVIDFSMPAGLARIAKICGEKKIPLVAATTGLDDEQHQAVLDASKQVPVVMAPNMSLGVNLTMKLVQQAAAALSNNPAGVDVEVIERHHRFKEDAPSGTALHFGKLVAEQMGQTEHVHGREGRPGVRPQSEIGYHALRTGDNVGEHTIVFGMMGETLELTIRGHTRDSYAYGALVAAKWIVDKEPGMYSMFDVLGL